MEIGKMLLGLLGVALIAAVIVGIVMYSKNISKKKDENTARVNSEINLYLSKYEENGVSSLDKNQNDIDWLPKNESPYGRYNGIITFKKYLKNGIRYSEAGHGYIVISDKAITIQNEGLTSGKRRFLYKNLNGKFQIIRTLNETKVSIQHKNSELIFNLDHNTLKYFAMALHLIKNPLKESNSISF